MGAVFQALDRQTRGLVAVKILSASNATDAGRFALEARVLADLKHPTIVRFIDYGITAHNEQYLVMEWLEGETLEVRLGRGPMAPSLVARLAARVLDGLAVVHRKGIIHRDIKPSNIFLSGWRVSDAKLIDFGVARRSFDPKRITKKGTTVGTPMYNAPEQARADLKIDGRVDMFALGVVLFEALTGEPAFTGRDPGEVMSKIAAGQAPSVAKSVPWLDPAMSALVQQMLARDPEDRPQEDAHVAHAFREFADRLVQEEPARPIGVKPGLRQIVRETISLGEQRIMSVLILAAPSPTGRPISSINDDPAPRIQGPLLDDEIAMRVTDLIEPFGGRVDRLLDRSLVITAPSLTTVTEQCEQIARMGLVLAAAFPEKLLAMATGPGVLLARMPAGEAVEVAAFLLEGAVAGLVSLDETSARMLGGRYRLTPERNARKILGERELDDAELDAPRTIMGVRTPFCGRERELANLQGLFEEAAEEQSARAAVVIGNPGVGKTRLVWELMSRLATERKFQLLRGQGALMHGSFAGVAWEKAVAKAGIMPEFPRDPAQVVDSLVTYVRARAAEVPVLWLLEDAHLADALSLQVMESAMRRLEDTPVLALVVGRTELDERPTPLLAKLSPVRIRLGPLTPRVAETMLGHMTPATATISPSGLLERAFGNPFFLEELARHAFLPGRGLVPSLVMGTVQGRIESLGRDTRRVLRAASVFGDAAPRTGIVALVGGPPEAVDEALAFAVESGVLEKQSAGEDYHFVDCIVREVIYCTLPAGDRAIARRLARTVLDQMGRALPEILLPGESRVDMTLSQIPALPFEQTGEQ